MADESNSDKPEDGPRQRGAREYFLHRGEYRNPFPHGSAEFNEYERGWMQSLKLNDGKLVKREEPSRPATPSARPPSSDYNAYAEMKGRSSPRK